MQSVTESCWILAQPEQIGDDIAGNGNAHYMFRNEQDAIGCALSSGLCHAGFVPMFMPDAAGFRRVAQYDGNDAVWYDPYGKIDGQ